MILSKPIPISELETIAQEYFGDMIKAVVDIARKQMAINAELHSDLECEMLSNGSSQESLWGINLYPSDFKSDDFIEFDSLINIRAWQGNRSRYVENEDTRAMITDIVKIYVIE